jgi:hypothetical protein
MARAIDTAVESAEVRARAAAEGPAWAATRGWDATAAGVYAALREVVRA